MLARIRAVFFDLGGTLFSNHEVVRVCIPLLEEASVRLGLEKGLQKIAPAFMQATKVANLDYVDRRFYLHRDLLMDTVRGMVRTMGFDPTPEFVDWFYCSQRAAVTGDVVLREDCLSTLEALRSRGLKLSILSNADDDYLDPMMENLGLAPFFDYWVSSEAAGSCKPDSGIFENALQKLGMEPGEVLFVGDSRVHDVQGASSAGLTSALIAERGGVSPLDDSDL